MAKRKPGPKIGQAGRFRKKNHPKYKKSHRQKTQTIRKDMPGSSGFIYLEASGMYLAVENRFVVTVSSKRRPDNLGPAIYLKRAVGGWDRTKNEDGSIRGPYLKIPSWPSILVKNLKIRRHNR